MINILIINDSPMLSAVMQAIVETEENYHVCGCAEDGMLGIAKAKELNPDLILMDLHMPRCNGAQAVAQILKNWPGTRILITTATVISNRTMIFETLAMGALDYVQTPQLPFQPGQKISRQDLREGGRSLLGKMGICLSITQRSLASKVAKQRLPSSPKNSGKVIGQRAIKPSEKPAPLNSSGIHYLAIGCSTGGPTTLAILLKNMPADFNGPIIVCQHMDEGFVQGLVDWLSNEIHFPVFIARHQSVALPGRVYIAPGGQHNLTVSSAGRLMLIPADPKQFYTPNIDSLFFSMAENLGNRAIGVVLTGMGQDGSEGLAAIETSGGAVYVQQANSAILSSMPEHALEAIKSSNSGYLVEQMGTVIHRDISKRLKRLAPGKSR